MTRALFHVKLWSISLSHPSPAAARPALFPTSRQKPVVRHCQPPTGQRKPDTCDRAGDHIIRYACPTHRPFRRHFTPHASLLSPLAARLAARLSPLAQGATGPRGHGARGPGGQGATGYVTARKTTQSGAARPTTVHSVATSPLTPHLPPLTSHRSPLAARRSPTGPHIACHRSHTEPARRDRDLPTRPINLDRRGVSRETWAYGLHLAPWAVLTIPPPLLFMEATFARAQHPEPVNEW